MSMALRFKDVADRANGLNNIIENLIDKMNKLSEKGKYSMQYDGNNYDITSRLEYHFKNMGFEVERTSCLSITIYWL